MTSDHPRFQVSPPSTKPARQREEAALDDATMATAATQSSPAMSPIASPPLSGIKKVFSSRRRSSDVQDVVGSPIEQLRSSVGSIGLDKSPTRNSTNSSPSRDDESSKSGSSGMKKLLPGHAKRKRRRIRDEELRNVAEDVARGRPEDNNTLPPPSTNQSSISLNSSLVTDDSETDA